MPTREEKLQRIEAYYGPRIAQRENAYNAYMALTAARDEKVMLVNRYYDLLEEAQRVLAQAGTEPPDPT